MPGLLQESDYNNIVVKKLHSSFAAEVSGVDFSQPLDDETFEEIRRAISKYGVCVFRAAIFSDEGHIAFSARFGELDISTAYTKDKRNTRLPYPQLFDVSNLADDGGILDPDSPRGNFQKGNLLFHVDSSFNPRRAGYSLLRAVKLPPPNMGGETQFADTRTAFEELPVDVKEDLLKNDYVVAHNLWQSRKTASPDFFADVEPNDFPMSRHRLVQLHEPSSRTNLYIAAHAHHIEGLEQQESRALIDKLYAYATQSRYVVTVPWLHEGDVVLWDNTCVMHRASGGAFEGKYRRDMRRTTVHDGSSTAWGLNPVGSKVKLGLP